MAAPFDTSRDVRCSRVGRSADKNRKNRMVENAKKTKPFSTSFTLAILPKSLVNNKRISAKAK